MAIIQGKQRLDFLAIKLELVGFIGVVVNFPAMRPYLHWLLADKYQPRARSDQSTQKWCHHLKSNERVANVNFFATHKYQHNLAQSSHILQALQYSYIPTAWFAHRFAGWMRDHLNQNHRCLGKYIIVRCAVTNHHTIGITIITCWRTYTRQRRCEHHYLPIQRRGQPQQKPPA